jgi:hypothetical protein
VVDEGEAEAGGSGLARIFLSGEQSCDRKWK